MVNVEISYSLEKNSNDEIIKIHCILTGKCTIVKNMLRQNYSSSIQDDYILEIPKKLSKTELHKNILQVLNRNINYILEDLKTQSSSSQLFLSKINIME